MFVNISNHPSARWEESQRSAALALSAPEAGILDIKFPQVPPEATEEDIEALANEVLASIHAAPEAAMVSGEFCLTAAIVARLQRRGIPCFAATTRRDVVETTGPNGDTVKTAVFRFVRFRRFPKIG